MFSPVRKSLLTLFAGAAILTAGTIVPAAAWDDWGGHRRWNEYSDGWRHEGWRHEGWRHDGWHRRPAWRGERCWIETRRVRVYTPWGPRLRRVEERVCG